jgi:hypothetical protein
MTKILREISLFGFAEAFAEFLCLHGQSGKRSSTIGAEKDRSLLYLKNLFLNQILKKRLFAAFLNIS